MSANVGLWGSVFVASAIFAGALPAQAQGHDSAAPMAQMTTLNTSDMKLMSFPGTPTCASGAVADGDPAKGASIFYFKLAPGCIFPWHWHTPNEHLFIISGEGRMEMKDGKPATLKAGAYAKMPTHHVHQFSCKGGCTLYVYSDLAFDVHYVDASGKELTPDEALKAVKETAVKAPDAAAPK